MSASPTIRIIIRPINEDDADEAVRLMLQSGKFHLLNSSAAIVHDLACDNQGAVATDEFGEIIGICLYQRFRLLVTPGSRSHQGYVEFTYISYLVIDEEFQGFGIGPRLGEATIAFAFAASEGWFPPVAAGAFQDNPCSQKAQEKGGMTCYAEGGFEIECDPFIKQLDRWVREEKEALGVNRPHTVQAFDMYHLPAVARWMVQAYEEWFVAGALELRVIDPSEGRSGFRRVLRDLGRGVKSQIKRLNLAKPNDAKMTIFRTAGYGPHPFIAPSNLLPKVRTKK